MSYIYSNGYTGRTGVAITKVLHVCCFLLYNKIFSLPFCLGLKHTMLWVWTPDSLPVWEWTLKSSRPYWRRARVGLALDIRIWRTDDVFRCVGKASKHTLEICSGRLIKVWAIQDEYHKGCSSCNRHAKASWWIYFPLSVLDTIRCSPLSKVRATLNSFVCFQVELREFCPLENWRNLEWRSVEKYP